MALFPVSRCAARGCATVFVATASIAISSEVVAQIRTDASLGRAAQTLTGPGYVIPESLGRLAGRNLFHSFQTFNINTRESANFTTLTPALANVISRVTGGTLSRINGQLKLTAVSGAPNFFFINPAGVTFGPGASIDVPGAFHVSTANYIRFPDGNLHVELNQASSFSSAAPEAFGFLGATPASITVRDGAQLITRPLQPISLIGGDIEINNAAVASTAGDIRIAAAGQSVQEIGFSGALPTLSGRLDIVRGGFILSSTSSRNAGSVKASAGSINIDGQDSGFAGIFSQAEVASSGSGGNIEVSAREHLAVSNGGLISSSTFSSGNAGSVNVSGGSINIDGNNISFTGIFSQAAGSGSGGHIEVSAREHLAVSNGGLISSDTFSSGNAGSVKVSAGSINIDANNSSVATGIFGQAASSGSGGNIEVSAREHLAVSNGGLISSDTFSSGNAGSVKVSAGSISIDANNSSVETGILSQAKLPSSGSAGNIEVSAREHLAVSNGGLIASDTFSSGNAGSVKVSAGSISIDGNNSSFTGIFSQARGASSGSGGNIEVSAQERLSLTGGGLISSGTFSLGNAGSVKVSAGSININRNNSSFATGIYSQAELANSGSAGNIEVTAREHLAVSDGGLISSGTASSENAGSVKVSGGSVTIDGNDSSFATGIVSQAGATSSGSAGNIEVSAREHLTVSNGGLISSDTFSPGHAGSVKVSAGSINIDGHDSRRATGIVSQANTATSGSAGNVEVSAREHLSVSNGALISSSTFSSGNAGSIKVSAGSINIDRQDNSSVTGIFGQANTGSSGSAGNIEVSAREHLAVGNGGLISSSTFSSGNAGSVKVNAGSINIDGLDNRFGTAIASDTASSGSAGNIEVSARGHLSVRSGGTISSSTFSSGNAGFIKVSAGSIAIEGQESSLPTGITSSADLNSTGSGGSVEVAASGNLSILGGGIISSSTFSSGNAGSVTVSAGSINIDGRISNVTTAILSDARSGSGNAGLVEVSAREHLSVTNGGVISSSTFSSGVAGTVKVSAGTLSVHGALSRIDASAEAGSSGQTGSVNVSASDSITLSNGGSLSIKNDAMVSDPGSLVPTTLSVTAPNITLKDSQITAASSGNVSASDIQIKFSDRLFLDPSSITTSANLGNGGSITIQGGKLIILENSQITTSVLGLTGNGGNISVSADALILNTGFIQANTAAPNASGGLVNVNVQTLAATGNSVFLGGEAPFIFQPRVFGFNVIQAAAPTGVSGTIQVTSPVLDVTASLRGLSAEVVDAGGLGRSLCETRGGSSLGQAGRGGLPPSARGLLRAESKVAHAMVTTIAPATAENLQFALSSGCL